MLWSCCHSPDVRPALAEGFLTHSDSFDKTPDFSIFSIFSLKTFAPPEGPRFRFAWTFFPNPTSIAPGPPVFESTPVQVRRTLSTTLDRNCHHLFFLFLFWRGSKGQCSKVLSYFVPNFPFLPKRISEFPLIDRADLSFCGPSLKLLILNLRNDLALQSSLSFRAFAGDNTHLFLLDRRLP